MNRLIAERSPSEYCHQNQRMNTPPRVIASGIAAESPQRTLVVVVSSVVVALVAGGIAFALSVSAPKAAEDGRSINDEDGRNGCGRLRHEWAVLRTQIPLKTQE
jgi:hypothetical protein